jgi:hypothetical protein
MRFQSSRATVIDGRLRFQLSILEAERPVRTLSSNSSYDRSGDPSLWTYSAVRLHALDLGSGLFLFRLNHARLS